MARPAAASKATRHTRTTFIPSDTSHAAGTLYYRRLAEMHPSERVRIGLSLWETANALQCAALRRMYPYADENEIAFHMAVARFGPELGRGAWRRE